MLNFKSFRAAKNVLAGIELMHMTRKGQHLLEGCSEMSLLTSLMYWQCKSIQIEELALVPGKITSINSQMRCNPLAHYAGRS
jgi:hypothetical protein